MKKSIFMEDNRKSNPGLHLLYVKWGTKHLITIDKVIKKFSSFGNTNLLGCIEAVQKECNKLIKENAAYADAQEILEGLGLTPKMDK